MSSKFTTKLVNFRHSLYSLFSKRKDAIMNLLDALTSHGHRCNSVVQLSTADCFKRQYSSITDAIADGLPEANWREVKQLVYQQINCVEKKKPNYFIIDCTPNPRPHATKLRDRHVTHAPNPAPGNKPICVGHQYSVIVVIPNSSAEKDKKWVLPVSAKRVPSHKKGNELGMEQLNSCIDDFGVTEQLNIAVTDSLYGTNKCRSISSTKENLVHIFRLRNNRNVFLEPSEPKTGLGSATKTGRKKEYGDKMQLGGESTHVAYHEEVKTTCITRKGKKQMITIKCWKNILLRGTVEFRSSQHPINLIQITVSNEQGEPVFKRPLWLGVLGKRRHELSLVDIQQAYAERYDIEHFFRFSKGNLLLDAYQTADSEHEELWWQLCTLAYVQLYLANGIVPSLPYPWERYLPEFQEDENQAQAISSPSKTQRGFANVLESIGTPAATCVPRGKPVGRQAGEVQVKRETRPMIFKTKKAVKKTTESLFSASELSAFNSNPQTIADLVDLVQLSLTHFNLTASDFIKLFENTS